MSCAPGKPCEEGKKRRLGITALVLMALIFLSLSVFSFVSSRGQVIPHTVSYAGYSAVEGKRVFQAYNCMDCHTIVGNGAYFGPDLTDIYAKAGPAWLEAFLPSAGGWPTRPAVQVHLANEAQVTATDIENMDAYLTQFPGAAERIERRGGHPTNMPNLPLTRQQVGKLIAFMKYTSEMNTEGWPPKPETDGLDTAWAIPVTGTTESSSGPKGNAEANASEQDSTGNLAQRGEQLAQQSGCMACHATTGEKKVGPGWGGLYDSTVTLEDGRTVTADTAYLAESIRDPDAAVVAGFPEGTMPSYASILDDEEIEAVVAYLKTLEGDAP